MGALDISLPTHRSPFIFQLPKMHGDADRKTISKSLYQPQTSGTQAHGSLTPLSAHMQLGDPLKNLSCSLTEEHPHRVSCPGWKSGNCCETTHMVLSPGVQRWCTLLEFSVLGQTSSAPSRQPASALPRSKAICSKKSMQPAVISTHHHTYQQGERTERQDTPCSHRELSILMHLLGGSRTPPPLPFFFFAGRKIDKPVYQLHLKQVVASVL